MRSLTTTNGDEDGFRASGIQMKRGGFQSVNRIGPGSGGAYLTSSEMGFATSPPMVMFHPGKPGSERSIRLLDTGVTNWETDLLVEN